ncbi:MAG TPA: LytR C-terminal domain-containing protein [Baekduia sp.]|nr:LytR C-terminal domain-containing protein [Baekduia sp.]
MTTPLVALSLTDQIEKFGAYAGFAAVVGLAVLSLLYFASAREVKRLREWADRAPERVADLEARIGALARQRATVPAPVSAGAAKKPAAQPASAAATAAGAQAGNGAPVPAAGQAAATAAGEGAPAGQAASEGAPAGQAAAAAAAGGAAAPPPGDLTEISKPPAQVGDETLAGAASRELRQNRPEARPRPQPPVRPSTQRLVESARASNAQRVQAARGAGYPGPVPPAPKGGEAGGRKRVAMIVGGVVAAAVVVILLVTTVFGGGDSKQPAKANRITTETSSDTTSTGPTIDRQSIEVTVLNGTTTADLAKGVANKLEIAGFKRGAVQNAPDQTRSATSVEYAEGQKAAGFEVQRNIPDVGRDAVIAMTPGTHTLYPDAAVVVTVGADQTPTG